MFQKENTLLNVNIFIDENNMKVDDIINKQHLQNLSEEKFCLEQSIKNNKERKINNKKVLNRRKNKLDEMIKNGDDFFSEEAIKERDVKFY